MVARKFHQTSKSLKMLWPGYSVKIILLFMSLLTAGIVKTVIYFIFLKGIIDQILKTSNTKFGPH